MTVKLAGRDDVAASTANGSNNILMTKYTASATGGATEIKLRVMASVAGNVTIGIYADSAGAPAALLGTSSSTAVSSGAEREITIALLAEVQITSGTAYWVAFNSSANIVAAKSEVAVRKYKGAAYGALPDPAGAGYTDETTYTDVTSIWGHTDATVSAVLITATATVLVPSLQADSNVAGVVLTASMETLSPAISLSLDAPSL